MEPERKTSKQEALQKKRKDNQNSDQNESDVEDQQSEDEESKDSFIVSDDDFQQSYSDEDYGHRSKKKKNKQNKQKKDKKKKKKKKGRRNSDNESVVADDLEVVDAAQGGLTRLKKNRDKTYKQNEDDDYEEEQQYEDMGAHQEDYQEGYGRYQDNQQSDLSEYQNKKYQQADLNDLLDQRARRQFFAETTDKEIVDMDLPERQIMKYKNIGKIQNKQISFVQQDIQEEDRSTQAKWIYEKLKHINTFKGHFQLHDQGKIVSHIENVINAINKQHLEIMYIYYYRKKIWSETLTLQILIKIDQLDDQWNSFSREFKALKDDMTLVIPSFQQVPLSLQIALNSCVQISQLKPFKDYSYFVIQKNKAKQPQSNSTVKNQPIKQVCGSGIHDWLTDKQVFLSPNQLCLNLRNRNQQKKPKTPYVNPDGAFRQLLKLKIQDDQKEARKKNPQLFPNPPPKKKQNPTEEDLIQQDENRNWRATFSFLSPGRRIMTIVDYLAFELYSYPQLRKILKQKYYKRLLLTTIPTAKGAHYINIYNQFFPVKRIKDKPISTLKKQLWILIREAQKLGLLSIQLKFEWQLTEVYQKSHFQTDPVCSQLSKYYFDLSMSSAGESWNLLRKQVLFKMLTDYFLPAFKQQLKQQLTRDATRQIIQSCCQKFRSQLNKGPSLREKQSIKILAMVLEHEKLGIAFVDEQGKQHSLTSIQLRTDDELKRFVGDELLKKLIKDNKPDMILVSANCRRAQTLRKELRTPSLFDQIIYVGYGQYQVPSLMANKNVIQGMTLEKCILQAVSMARLKKNPMSQILGLWSQNIQQNAVYSMNLHPLQRYINKRKLIDSLEKVAIEIVNLVGVDIDDIRNSDHCRNILRFVSGLGPRKAFDLIEKVKQKYPPTRKHLLDIVKSKYVYTNCSPFIKFERAQHLELLQKSKNNKNQDFKKQKHSKKMKDTDKSQLNLLDMTRIPQQWYALTQRLFLQAIKASNFVELKHKKNASNLSDEQIAVRQMFKNPEKLATIQWQERKDENQFYDENLVKTQIMNSFKDPRDIQKVMENRDIFYNLLKQTPETLKKYMVVTVKILSVSQNKQFLNVVIPENGLFGFIKLPNDRNNQKKNYEKGMFVKAVITGFPFDERRQRGDRNEGDQQIQLLKVDMMLNFPHRSEDKNHDCHRLCFPNILKQIHPNIDLDKDNFDLDKQHLPIVQAKQQTIQRPKTELKRISHPKFKSINMATAVEQVKQLKIGDFIIRPSTEGNNFLTMTWHFYNGIVGHIKFKSQQRQPGSLPVYRVLDKAQDKVYTSIDEIIERYLKPMNNLIQDVISNKKFLPMPLDQIEEKIKLESTSSQQYIQYFFGCSPEYPQFFILVYMYKQKRPIKQLIRVKSDGLYFHDQTFHSLRQLITFFKEHLKDKKYQSYARNTALKK